MFDSEEREVLAQEYFIGCQKPLRRIDDPERTNDPHVVLRAVRYLGTQAIPPMRDSVEWFREGPDVILGLVFPEAGVPKDAETIVEGIRCGMAEAERIGMEDCSGGLVT